MSGANGNGYERPPASERKLDKRLRPDEGLPPAGSAAPHGGLARAEFFGALRIPMQNGTGKPENVKRKGA